MLKQLHNILFCSLIMQGKARYQNDVMFSALSGLLFFWILIQKSIKNNTCERNDEEKDFVNSWCTVGNGTLVLVILFFLSVARYEFVPWEISLFLTKLFGLLVLTIVVISLPLIIFWKHLHFYSLEQNEEEKYDMVTSFIPLVSSYHWFWEDRLSAKKRLKEAQLWLLFIRLALVFFNSYMPWMVLAWMMVIRIVLACSWKDFFSAEQRERMSHRFSFYPEEFFSSIYVLLREGNALARGKQEVSVEEVLRYQKSYGNKRDSLTWVLMIGIWWGLLALLLWYWWRMKLYRKIIPLLWLVCRGGILLYRQKRIPKIPIVAEITA